MNHSLNHVFRLVWNHRLGTWCVASEIARGRGKSKSGTQGHVPAPRQLWPLVLLLGSATAWAELPQGGQVSAGQGQLNYQGNTLHIQQHSDKLALDWQSFSVGKDNKVIFNQPGAQSVALNRVLGADVSRIQGAIKANGQVFLLNPNGVLFSPSAQVNTGGLVASTLELSNDDFMAGHFQFAGDSTAAVTNQGAIKASEGGTIALIAATIVNEGSLDATAGNVLLGAGRKVTLDMGGPVKLRVDEGALNTLIEQGGAIRADGGRVYLTAGAAGKLATSVINHTGITRAQTLATGEQGEIVLLGDMQQGQLQVAGTLDASAPAVEEKGGDGGFIETSAAKVQINNSVQVTTLAENGNTGEWLIDPTDFYITAGSATKTDSGIGASTLSAQLAGSNITIETVDAGTEAGDIYVNAPVSWSADTTLSLNADNNIYINQAITATGTNAGLVLNTGASKDYSIASGASITLSGSGATLAINGTDYTLIHDMAALDAIDTTGLGGAYALAGDLDASTTSYDHALVGVDSTNAFAGTFAGLGHTITDLTIENTAATTLYWGLFGVNTGTIRDIGLVGGSVTATGSSTIEAGGLVGYNNRGTITNATATGDVTAESTGTKAYAGGLVGFNDNGIITNATATGAVTAKSTGENAYAGGLVGRSYKVTITNATATGDVTATSTGENAYAGGLVGNNFAGTITNATATGAVTATAAVTATSTGENAYAGGLVGFTNIGSITNATATGAVTATSTDGAGYDAYAGGLVGFTNIGSITNAYATGTAESTGSLAYAGGLVGANTAIITNAYATGTAESTGSFAYAGGLVGFNEKDTIKASYWDTETSRLTHGVGTGDALGVTGLTTDQFQDRDSFVGWDFDTTWAPPSSGYYPQLYALTPVVFVKANDISMTYGDSLASPSQTNLSGGPIRYVFGPSSDTIYTTLGAGAHLIPGAVTSDKGVTYRVIGSGGTLTVDPRAITVSADNQSRTYGDANPTLTYGVSAGSLINGDSLSGSLTTVATKSSDVGSYDITQGSLDNSNYAITYQSGKLTINKANLTVTAQNASKTYDGLAYSGGNGVSYDGFVIGEDASVLSGTLTYGGNAQGAINAGDYTLSASGLSSNNYAINYVDGTLTIGKGVVDLMISAKDAFKVYDGEAWFGGNGIDVDGLAAGETLTDLDGTLVWGGSAQGAVNAGDYTITASGLSSPNYEIRFNDGTLTIGKAPLTIAAQNASKTYDGLAYTSGNVVTYSGFVAGENTDVLSGTLTYGGNAQGAVNVGNYTLSASGLSSNNYNINYVDGTLSIGKAPLTIAAQNVSKTYDGQAWSGNNGVSYNGFVAGENTDVLSGTLTYGGSAQGAVNAGNYTLSASGLSSNNYNINFVDGTLNIGKAPLTIAAQNVSKTYDGQAWSGNNGVSYNGFVNGEDVSVLNGSLSWGGTADGAVNAGNYTLTPSGLNADNYDINFVDGTLTIDKANLMVTAQDALWVQDGSGWSGGNGISYEGFVNGEDASVLQGDLLWGGSAQGAEMPGDYTLSASGLSADNYQLTFIDGQLRIISPMEAAGQPYQNAVQQAQHIDRAPRPIRYTQLAYANEPLKVVSTGIRLP